MQRVFFARAWNINPDDGELTGPFDNAEDARLYLVETYHGDNSTCAGVIGPVPFQMVLDNGNHVEGPTNGNPFASFRPSEIEALYREVKRNADGSDDKHKLDQLAEAYAALTGNEIAD